MTGLEMQQTLLEFEKARIHSLLFCLLYFVIAVGISFLLRFIIGLFTPVNIIGSILIFIPILFLAFILTADPVQTYQVNFKKGLLKECVPRSIPSFLYMPEKDINKLEFILSGLFITTVSDFQSNGIAEGKLGDFFIRFSDVEAFRSVKKRRTGKTGQSTSEILDQNEISVFKGFFVVLENQSDLSSNLNTDWRVSLLPRKKSLISYANSMSIIYNPAESTIEYYNALKNRVERNRFENNQFPSVERLPAGTYEISRSDSEEVAVDDPEFNKHFIAYAKDENARKLLQNQLLRQKLVEISDTWKDDIYLSLSTTRCYVAFCYKKNFLSPNIIVPLKRKMELKITENMENLALAIKTASIIAGEMGK